MKESPITLRKFRVKDADEVSAMIRKNLLEVNSKDYSEEAIKYLYELYNPKYILSSSNKRKMYVAIRDGAVIGTASLDFDEIYSIFVCVKLHGQGIGKMLVKLMEEIASNNGFTSIKLVSSTTAQKFYEKLGYSVVGEETTDKLGKEPVMQRFLV